MCLLSTPPAVLERRPLAPPGVKKTLIGQLLLGFIHSEGLQHIQKRKMIPKEASLKFREIMGGRHCARLLLEAVGALCCKLWSCVPTRSRTPLRQRLHLSFLEVEILCPLCGRAFDCFGDHAAVCPCAGDRTLRHRAIAHVFYEAASTGLTPLKEEGGLPQP